ncbi:MAG: RNA polymerase factor sigma-54 [Planctomycetes bacterium]|nr:RNA polymerase factor sigma-54 [Planctomycetota bacterium]
MPLEARLGQRQEQRLALLPQMLQSIEVLQLATTDLVQFLEQAALQNETLELHEPEAPDLPPESGNPRAERDDQDRHEYRSGRSDDGEDGKLAFLANVPGRSDDLLESVRQQLAFRNTPALLAEVTAKLAEQLDERGLLPVPLEQLAAELDLPLALLQEALDELQQLEPKGLGAGDTVAAMLAQIQGDPDLPVIERLLREHLDALGRNKLPEVAKALGLAVDELGMLLERVRELEPRPAAAFHKDAAPAVRPDAYVRLADGATQVTLDDRQVPAVAVSADYAALASDRTTAREVRDYLRPKLRAARDLASAVAHRQETLLAVVRAVMQEQQPFLQQGKSAIRPLRMSVVAERLGVHTSTVSRAIAGKHVQTERGLFALKDFFDGARLEGAPAAGQGRLAIAQRIADLVAAEDKAKPLSDDDLVTALGRAGVHAARRTVTKYRKELGIPSSYLRRRHQEQP